MPGATYAAGTAAGAVDARPTLMRPRLGRKVAGVCQGLSNQYGWDVTPVRVVMLLLAILAFPVGLILYAILWLVAPEEAFALPSTTTVSHG